jgi:hypothetical protein
LIAIVPIERRLGRRHLSTWHSLFPVNRFQTDTRRFSIRGNRRGNSRHS